MSLVNNSIKWVITWGQTGELVLRAAHPGIITSEDVFHTKYCNLLS